MVFVSSELTLFFFKISHHLISPYKKKKSEKGKLGILYILEFCIYYVHIKSHHFKFQFQILPVDNKSRRTDTITK